MCRRTDDNTLTTYGIFDRDAVEVIKVTSPDYARIADTYSCLPRQVWSHQEPCLWSFELGPDVLWEIPTHVTPTFDLVEDHHLRAFDVHYRRRTKLYE